ACLYCPLTALCLARQRGLQDRVPVLAPKPRPLAVTEVVVILLDGGRVLIFKRAAGGLWEHFWEFPTIHLSGPNPAGRSIGTVEALREALEKVSGIRAAIGPPCKTLAYTVTKHRVNVSVHAASSIVGEPRPGPGLVAARWVEPERLADYTFSSAGRRLI